MPGLGNPLTELDVIDFNRYCERVGAVAKMATGKMSARDSMLIAQGVY